MEVELPSPRSGRLNREMWEEKALEDQNSNFWRLCEELTIDQAAHLLSGLDPSQAEWEEGETVELSPEMYRHLDAARQALTSALRVGVIKGGHVPKFEIDAVGNRCGPIDGSTDIRASFIQRDSLVQWLAGRGVRSGFFFPGDVTDTPDFLDRSNPRYAPKLAAAVMAWRAVTDPGKKSPKQALERWLREHAADYGLADDNGNPVAIAIEECSKVANWRTKGGAPKNPGP